MSAETIDYKTKCEEIAAENVKLTAEVQSLTAVCDKQKGIIEQWKKEFDTTVQAHNEIRDELTTALTTLSAKVANAKFLDSAQIEQRRKQMEQIKAELKQQ